MSIKKSAREIVGIIFATLAMIATLLLFMPWIMGVNPVINIIKMMFGIILAFIAYYVVLAKISPDLNIFDIPPPFE